MTHQTISDSYRLRISPKKRGEHLSPQIPMPMLAEYMNVFAKLLGGQDYQNEVIFKGVIKGSALLKSGVIESTRPYIDHYLNSANDDSYEKLETLLFNNGHKAELQNAQGKILRIIDPIEKFNDSIEVTTETSFSGQVIKIGGKDESIPLTLRDSDGTLYNLTIKGYRTC